jgi:3-dehydroquinate synthase
MEGIPVSDPSEAMKIDSHKGHYYVSYSQEVSVLVNALEVRNAVFLVDERVLKLHGNKLKTLLNRRPVVAIEARESNKSLEIMPKILETLLEAGVRRGDTLVVIGGGIVQDIGCFIASTLFRGLEWVFVPTTLLAQADSCIGSKSSINLLGHKNIVGTFNPPNQVHICAAFLETLSEVEIQSGIGEMLKVHMLDNINSLSKIISHYDSLLSDQHVMMDFLKASLSIKKKFIEADEFDKGIRNLLNYGHSFGHAIEAATNFKMPHGIAVTMGMDIANFITAKIGFGTNEPFLLSHDTMRKNYLGFQGELVDIKLFRSSLEKDKKNTGDKLALILPNKNNNLEKISVNKTEDFWNFCAEFFDTVRFS